MKSGLFIVTAVLYALSCVLYLAVLTRGSTSVRRLCNTALGAAAGAHLAFLAHESPVPAQMPLSDISQVLSVSAFGIALTFLLSTFRFNVTVLGAFVAPISLMLFLASGLGASYAPVPAEVKTVMLTLHIAANILGLAAFALAFAAGVAYIVQERLLRRRKLGGVFQRLPSLNALDRVGLQATLVGFPLLTFGMVTGTFWLLKGDSSGFFVSQALGLIAWSIFAAVIVLRVAAGWQGRRAALGTILGFVCTLLVLFGYAFRAAAAAGAGGL